MSIGSLPSDTAQWWHQSWLNTYVSSWNVPPLLGEWHFCWGPWRQVALCPGAGASVFPACGASCLPLCKVCVDFWPFTGFCDWFYCLFLWIMISLTYIYLWKNAENVSRIGTLLGMLFGCWPYLSWLLLLSESGMDSGMGLAKMGLALSKCCSTGLAAPPLHHSCPWTPRLSGWASHCGGCGAHSGFWTEGSGLKPACHCGGFILPGVGFPCK